MKKYMYFLTSGLLAANLTASAEAADYDNPAMGKDKMKGDRMAMDKMKGDQTMGWHKMTGTIANIDYAKGVLTLKSGGAPEMTLHFPPASIKDLKNGDTITVNLGFSKEGKEGKEGKERPAAPASGGY